MTAFKIVEALARFVTRAYEREAIRLAKVAEKVDAERELDVTKNDGRLLVKVCKFDNSIVNYDYELSRINSEIRKEYR